MFHEAASSAGQVRLTTPPVFMYHSISPSGGPDPHRLRVHPDRLDRHLRLLRRLGLRGVSLSELLRAQERREAHRLVGLTFDDGYTDYLEHALPVLQHHGMTSTLYVVAGRLGGTNEWDEAPRLDLVDADQVRAVAAAGQEIGSHTMTHPHLPRAGASALLEEISGSREVLQDVLQSAVPGFCYPYGEFDDAAREAVRAAGYDHGCVIGDYAPGDRFTLPRCYISPRDTSAHLVARMARHSLRLGLRGRL
ncbi:polysaccharide deacetylase [Arthrobacter pityocampae]|uniref:Polysaccharide deacetylase n=1 Tax=Arthrobacter pityocampae TaxID=547334 RepID=A0A2S5IXA6_9MICC|nr:polysaccharide deacetylase family protein [Arthrobacter pityocampae]PPB49140.1 polysaccharide deacetylase [Arthrobacter pityocampae]